MSKVKKKKKSKNYMNNKLVKNFIHDNWKLLINEKNMNYVGQKKKKKIFSWNLNVTNLPSLFLFYGNQFLFKQRKGL